MFPKETVRNKIVTTAMAACLFLGNVVTGSAATVTYSFEGQVPTNNGPMPGSFVLSVADFITGTPQSDFTGSDFDSCSAPGTGPCFAEFFVGPSPISGQANDIGFGKDVCCFIYFFPDLSFVTPGTYTADPFHSAGTAQLTVSVNEVPEPGGLGLAGLFLSLAGFVLRARRWTKAQSC
jgi:hypothetical protein